jgi:AcrR family transcriptional regulator/DNA-binding MarR family transcriptional regulator
MPAERSRAGATVPRSAIPASTGKGDAAREDPLARGSIGELQRARILAAVTEVVHELGAGRVTVAHIVTRSGVSRRTFYEIFEDRDSCLLAAFDQAAERANAALLDAYENAAGRWEQQLRATLAALLRFLEQEPALGGLLVVDVLATERHVLERRAQLLDELIDALHRDGRRARPGSPQPPRIVAEGAVGAALALVHARMLAATSPSLSGLLNPLMAMIVLPYLGPAAAERERAQPTPRARRRSSPTADPLRALDMRLTYRTVRVLQAIAEHPAASGRGVADASGVSDQGQMSKLLARLRQLGLIDNAAAGRGRGEPNAWVLTTQGHEVERAIRARTAS